LSVSSERKRELKGLLKKMRINFRSFDLLNISLSHKSFLNETQNSDKNNEKLEFLGDSVLGMVISEYLYKTYKNLSEGDLARIKSHVVSEDSLSKIAREIDLSRYILIGKGEEQTGGRYKKTILADTFEALIGSYYLDSNSLAKVRQFIVNFFTKEIELVLQNKHEKDYKTLLQEYVQKNYKVCPVYRLIRESGPEHDKSFSMEVELNGKIIGIGEGKSKKDAEKEAAKNAYIKISSVSVKTETSKIKNNAKVKNKWKKKQNNDNKGRK